MEVRRVLVVGLMSLACVAAHAQQADMPKPLATAVAKPVRTAYYVDASVLNVSDLIPEPPAPDSAASKADLEAVRHVEQTRTPEQVAQAKADDAEEDMFVFKTVLGPQFTAEALPRTAELGVHVKNEQGVIGNQLKMHFERPRPYQVDSTLHPVCEVKPTHDSYPSGHSLTGYLEALTLAEIVPEKRVELLARADDYAHNRVVCGVHYPTDTEASRRIAYVIFGYMLATPRFQRDLAAAKLETRRKLGLGVE